MHLKVLGLHNMAQNLSRSTLAEFQGKGDMAGRKNICRYTKKCYAFAREVSLLL